jgi:hypothetical protein
MNKDSVIQVADSMMKDPLTYLNTFTGVISFMQIEEWIKIMFYLVSISATILVSYKYWLEIKKLKKQEKLDGKSTEQEDISDL